MPFVPVYYTISYMYMYIYFCQLSVTTLILPFLVIEYSETSILSLVELDKDHYIPLITWKGYITRKYYKILWQEKWTTYRLH